VKGRVTGKAGLLAKLVELLSSPEVKLQMAALGALTNIVSGAEEPQRQAVLVAGPQAHFTLLLSHPDRVICYKALHFIAQLCAAGGRIHNVDALTADASFLILSQLDKVRSSPFRNVTQIK
jgi:hypothetical protein